MRIVYCIDSIRGVGGIQKVTVEKAGALAALPGNEVWILTADNSGAAVFPLSPRVVHRDLGINYYEDDWKSRWHVLKGILVKRRKHRNALKKVLREIQPDVIISVGQSEKNFLPAIRGRWATVREFHFVRTYRKLQARTGFERFLAWGGDLLDRFVLKKYDGIVVLTREDKERNWRQWKNVHVIPNSVSLPPCISSLAAKRVIAVGRLTYQKNFTSLIRAFSSVVKRFPEWSLDIFGDGEEKAVLASEIQASGLASSVRLMGNCPDIQRIMPEYSLYVLSSRFEGFGVVLIEAMSCGLPVVSYACPCGPKDIIRDGVDGFLVPPADGTLLAERICRLIEDEDQRRAMGAAALGRAKDFSIEKILPQWTSLFEGLVRKK